MVGSAADFTAYPSCANRANRSPSVPSATRRAKDVTTLMKTPSPNSCTPPQLDQRILTHRNRMELQRDTRLVAELLPHAGLRQGPRTHLRIAAGAEQDHDSLENVGYRVVFARSEDDVRGAAFRGDGAAGDTEGLGGEEGEGFVGVFGVLEITHQTSESRIKWKAPHVASDVPGTGPAQRLSRRS